MAAPSEKDTKAKMDFMCHEVHRHLCNVDCPTYHCSAQCMVQWISQVMILWWYRLRINQNWRTGERFPGLVQGTVPKLCPDSIHERASTFSSPPSGSQASRNKKPKCVGLNWVSLCCSQTVRKSRLQDMPREAPTPQARCRSYIFCARGVVPPSNSLFQKSETSGAFWLALSRV